VSRSTQTDFVEVNKTTALKLKAKQSFRNLFPKSNPTPTEKLVPQTSEPKRLSMTVSGKTLAKRISKNFSKVHLPKYETERSKPLSGRTSALDSLEAASSNTTTEPSAVPETTTAKAFHNMVNHITGLTPNSPEQVRNFEATEVSTTIFSSSSCAGSNGA
jgi:hypothetical protein